MTSTPTPLALPLTAPGEGAQAGVVREAVEATVSATSRADRLRSADPEAYGVPTGREEEWRFSPLGALADLVSGQPGTGHLDWATDLPDGVTVTTATVGDPVLEGLPLPVDRISALAVALSDGAVLVRVPPEHSADRPVRIVLTGAGELVRGRIVVDVGRFAATTVVLEHRGSARYAE